MNCLNGTDANQGRVLCVQWHPIQSVVQVVPVLGIKVAVSDECSESLGRKAALHKHFFEKHGRRWFALQNRKIAEQAHGVGMEDPVILRSNERSGRGRRQTLQHLFAGLAKGF